MLVDYKLPADLPSVIPVFPLSGALLLPRVLLPLNIFEPRYLSMINDAMSSSRIIGIIQPRNSSQSGPYGLYDAGCVGRLTTYNETEDGRILVTLTGLCRFQVLEELDVTTSYRQVKADYDPFSHDRYIGTKQLYTTAARVPTIFVFWSPGGVYLFPCVYDTPPAAGGWCLAHAREKAYTTRWPSIPKFPVPGRWWCIIAWPL